MITKTLPKSWQDLQLKVADILKQCGFDVEVEKTVASGRGKVELDVYAEELIDNRTYSIICECKQWTSNIPQLIIHAFRTVVSDLGCNKGYIITTSKFQSGAKATAEMTNIELLTWGDFQKVFFESWYIKYFYETLSSELYLSVEYHIVDWFDDLTKEDKLLYNSLKNQLHEVNEVKSYLANPIPEKLFNNRFTPPLLPLKNNLYDEEDYYGVLPDEILTEDSYQEFLEKFIQYGKVINNNFLKLHNKYTLSQ